MFRFELRTFLDGQKSSILGNFHPNAPRSAQAKEATSILGCSLPATAASWPGSKALVSIMLTFLMFRSVAFWMFRPVHCQKNRVILVLCHTFVGMPFCQLFRLFSCPWVDRIYCDDYVTTKIESKCRRREILFLCVSISMPAPNPGSR
jgi:hypothetical protein